MVRYSFVYYQNVLTLVYDDQKACTVDGEFFFVVLIGYDFPHTFETVFSIDDRVAIMDSLSTDIEVLAFFHTNTMTRF